MRGDGIKKLGDLFDIYRSRLRAPEKSVITAVQEVVADVLDIEIAETDVRYTPATRTVHLRSSGPLRSEIVLKKDEILLHLKGRLGPQSAPKDIL